jgi:Zn2+/Cd2+-exporting ATPase
MNRKRLTIDIVCLVIAIILLVFGYALNRNNSETWLIALLFGFSFAIGGFAQAKEGIIKLIKNKTLNVEILMILAAIGAFIIGDYFEGAILIIIFSVSGILELYATSKSQKALTNLLKLAPKTAVQIIDGHEKEVEVETLLANDEVIVKVGQQIPIDGVIVKGTTTLNQSAITGESMPVNKEVNEIVYAGSINLESAIVIRATKDAHQSTVQKIVAFVKQAQENKPKVQTLVEKIEKYYAYVVILLAALFMIVPTLFGWWDFRYAFNRAIIVLVVGSPCALVASISPAILSALSNGARKKILIKGGPSLEKLIGLKGVVFDKTGTITLGQPKVINIEIIDEMNQNDVFSIIKTMENHSNHPLAKAVVNHLSDIKIIPNIKTNEKSGRGINAQIGNDNWYIGRFDNNGRSKIQEKYNQAIKEGYSVISIIKNSEMIGFITLADTIKENAKQVVDGLKKMGMETTLLTGDTEVIAQLIGKDIKIDKYYADCFPEDKVKRIEELKIRLKRVMMVGDGINDAPALAAADSSIAMGKGTDVSLEVSDIVITNDKLENIIQVIKLGKRTRRIILQNVIFSIGVIIILMLANVFGVIELPLGVIAHETSTILVILNSLRLLIK